MGLLSDGHATKLTFSVGNSGAQLTFVEKELTPPGVDMGEMNDVTNMDNEEWRTFVFRKLKTLTNMDMSCHYDPAFLDEILDMLGINQELTLEHSDESHWTFWGGIQSFQPDRVVEGSPPMATVRIGVTNHNGTDGAIGTETAPTYTAAA